MTNPLYNQFTFIYLNKFFILKKLTTWLDMSYKEETESTRAYGEHWFKSAHDKRTILLWSNVDKLNTFKRK